MIKKALQIFVGLTIGLVAAEFLFRARDDASFPHVNFYVPDAERAVRLESNASESLKLGVNPITTARTNSLGFRGGEWPATTGEDVIVVGDSQVFGLGVEDGETASAVLAAELKVPVLNAGVPTYGPREYLATADELLKTRKAKHVVFVLNASNDFFELTRPNTTRHAVWDGWAVRKENAPGEVTQFPFRHALMAKSHLVYALRRWLAGKDISESLKSEGHWKDLVELQPAPRDEVADKSARSAVNEELLKEKRTLEKQPPEPEQAEAWEGPEQHIGTGPLRGFRLEKTANANPGDIVWQGGFEMSRRVTITADMIRLAAEQLENARIEDVKKRAVFREQQLKAIENARAKRLALEAEKKEARARIQNLRWSMPSAEPLPPALVTSVRDLLSEFERSHPGVQVTLVVLPLDVQVSRDEWKKYGAEPIDLEGTLTLNRQLVEVTRAAGMRAVDLLEPLRATEPGAFLDGDLHLTPKGQGVVAKVIAETLREPAPPRSELAELPTPLEWDEAPQIPIETTLDECEARIAKSWLRVFCRSGRSVMVTKGDANELALSGGGVGAVSAVIPLEPPQEFVITFDFEGLDEQFTVNGPLEKIVFHPVNEFEDDPPLPHQDALSQYSRCAQQLLEDKTEVWGETSMPCIQQYAADCVALMACAQGHPGFRPKCANGAGRAGRCRQ
ncbi:MAG: hypothetical protein QM817_31265 [Archangium sp.]